MCHSISGALIALAISARARSCRAGLALDQKRPLERDRGVDRDLEVGLAM